MTEKLSAFLSTLEEASTFDLGRLLHTGMAQSPYHPPFRHALFHRHGDVVRADGTSSASDLIVTGGHVGTHIDAFGHASAGGLVRGGIDAQEAQRGGRMTVHGAETIAPLFARGILLDLPRFLETDVCPPDYRASDLELAACAERQGLARRPGDVVFVRTGWGRHFSDPTRFYGAATGAPGPDESGARWLAAGQPRAVAGETAAFEYVPPAPEPSLLPAHRVLLVEEGVHIIEMCDLEPLSQAGVDEFAVIVIPLKILGGTGSPVRPIALVPGA